MRRKGFAYIVAVLILGLLALMGLFLMQSSSTEYSQAAMSVYATMAQQLAEGATDEAFLRIERELKTSKMGPLLRQGATAQNGSTGLNPRLLDILPDYKDAAVQTLGLVTTHINRPTFEIESILPSITDFRPIDYGWFSADECVYKPKNRADGFNTPISRDYLLSITFTTKVSMRVGGKKHIFQYALTHDMKVVNVGPIARSYSLFSCVGVDLRVQDDIFNDLNRGKGRLILWNIPFQSRVYIHGPAVIGVENPDFLEPGNESSGGGYIINKTDLFPGANQAFQYDDTYAGLSYLPYPARALWQKRSIWGGAKKEDFAGMTADEQRMYGHNTYIKKGRIPKLPSRSSEMASWLNFGEKYVRGIYQKEKFLPGGPYCRTPWQFVGERPAGWNNQTPETWPDKNPNIKIEHRYVTGDPSVNDNTKIYADLMQYRLFSLTQLFVSVQKIGSVRPEFSLTYGNPHDAESFIDGFGILTANLFSSIWETITVVPRMAYIGGEALVHLISPRKDPLVKSDVDFSKVKNFFPSNYKNFQKAAVLKLRNVDQIPKENGVWVLDGVYWLDYFQTTGPVYYKGKGVIFVGDFVPSKPFTIGGNILRYKDTANPGAKNENHLTLVYYPLPGDGRLPDDSAYLNECQMIFSKNKGITVEASVFSFAGIKAGSSDPMNAEGILSDLDYTNFGMDPNKPTSKWKKDMEDKRGWGKLANEVNTIAGNYITYYIKKFKLNSDLWVIHDETNPFYFNKDTRRLKEDYSEADEIMAHAAQLSPKIQHLAFSGGGGD